MSRSRLVLALCLAVGIVQGPAAQTVTPAPAAFVRAVDPIVADLLARFDEQAAMGHVEYASRFWRLAGNEGYDGTIDRIGARITPTTSTDPRIAPVRIAYEEYAGGNGWDHSVGTLAIARDGQPDDVVLSKEKERLALCINSFSTAPGGVTAPLVDVGAGARDEDFANKDLKGAVVLGDADAGGLWRRAIAKGAIGVISTALPKYLNADPPGAAKVTPRDEWDILQWSSVPYDETTRGFGFKASPRAAARLRKAIAAAPAGAPVKVHVTIASTFSRKPTRTLVGEINGATHPAERIVLAAHVQEPGANDNASGVATLAELFVALTNAIEAKKIPRPARTITFLWLNEISGSNAWIKLHPDQARNTKYMFSLDMTGEDIAKTGGSFLIERWPDPGAVWDRPWDPHSEWGRGNVRAESLKGDLINDLHLAVCARVAARTKWVVKSNPYEGGSDHTVFGGQGIPSLLNWHFTDRYYHTNFDTPDKVSAAEMKNVAAAVGASAWLMASADESMAGAVGELVAGAGKARLEIEKPGEPAAFTAWKKWYAEAVRSAARLVPGAASAALSSKLDALAAPFEKGTEENLDQAPRRPLDQPKPCGEDQRLDAPLPLTGWSVILAGDSRQFVPCPASPAAHPAEHREQRELDVIDRAAAQTSEANLRRRAAQARARLGLPAGALLKDSSPAVRIEALYSFVTAPAAAGTFEALTELLRTEPNLTVKPVIIETIGAAPYRDSADRDRAEALLLEQSKSSDARVMQAAAKGLETLLRQDPRRPIADGTRTRLRELATTIKPPTATFPAAAYTRVRILAMLALATARDGDEPTLLKAAADPDWQVRRLAALRLDAAKPTQTAIVAKLAADPAFQVRYDMVAVLTREAARTKSCKPLTDLLADPETTVVLRVLDQMPDGCADEGQAVAVLTPWASSLARATAATWHRPAHAFRALARLDAAAGAKLLDAAASHAVWQVRALAAGVAVPLNAPNTLTVLAGDAVPNVRTAALDAMRRASTSGRVDAAIAALSSGDNQLIRAAALTLEKTPAEDRPRAIAALLAAFTRLTALYSDNSRDPRMAILTRLDELLPADRAAALKDAINDFDPEIRTTAAAMLAKQTPPASVASQPLQRYPFQPASADLVNPPTLATITMADGKQFRIQLNPIVAPVTVARFAALARAGYYDGLTFHRIAPNFVVQGGSPGASEYVGDDRYMRDELSFQSHVRGAVGISTRGRDTGDGQIFIDLVDVPRLDHGYTVFGNVVSGMDVVDRLLEGATI
ncbi:MAG TPA: peptidylprolyl isomerase, partial [Vicinamibacterales bacterium]|nr:peptidylprolyl isomerase [Vicinamibacterales bacterium]